MLKNKTEKQHSYDIASMPKVTLHEHIEGTVTPEICLVLAKRHGVNLSDDLIMKDGSYDKKDFPNGRYGYEEGDFMGFINTYDDVANLVRTPEDYYTITKDYLSKNAQEGGIYVELIISPVHMASEVEPKTGKVTLNAEKYKAMLSGMTKATEEIKKETGLETRFIATGVRNMGVENVKEVAELVKDNPHKLVTGFGLAGNENEFEVKDFHEGLVETAHKEAGLPLALHAGEIRDSQSIWDALEAGASRIGHGISAIEDSKLVEELAKKNIMLEVCPTSNRLLVQKLEGSLDKHPLRKLYDAGVRVTINPDDAGIFGTHTGKEYRIAKENFGFSKAEFIDIALCGIEASFSDEATKKKLKNHVYKNLNESDRKSFKDLATKTSNPYLKKRLESRLIEIRQNKAKTRITEIKDNEKTTKAVIIKQRHLSR
ncbi:MAG: adenosine deaminase [Alphaproteobacteria bacterium]|nr:adenosine deaminase [Alphaproteobacteria bacterium]